MKKRRKKRDYYTLDGELLDNFLEHIEKNNLNKSKLIQSLIEEYMMGLVKKHPDLKPTNYNGPEQKA